MSIDNNVKRYFGEEKKKPIRKKKVIEIDGVVNWQLKVAYSVLKAYKRTMSRRGIYERAIEMTYKTYSSKTISGLWKSHPLCFWTREDIDDIKHNDFHPKSSADIIALRLTTDLKKDDSLFFRYSQKPEEFGLKEDKEIYRKRAGNIYDWIGKKEKKKDEVKK